MSVIVEQLNSVHCKAVLIAIATAVLMSGSFAAQEKATKQEIRRTLQQIAADMNKRTPRMLDEDIRHDSTVVSGLEIRYNYTLVKYLAVQVDAAVIQKKTKPKLRNSVCNGPDSQVFVNYKIPVNYVYYGKDGKEITHIRIDTATC